MVHWSDTRDVSGPMSPSVECALDKFWLNSTAHNEAKAYRKNKMCIKGESNPRRVDGNDPGYHYPINAITEHAYDIVCNRPDAWLRNRRDFKAEGGPISTPYLY